MFLALLCFLTTLPPVLSGGLTDQDPAAEVPLSPVEATTDLPASSENSEASLALEVEAGVPPSETDTTPAWTERIQSNLPLLSDALIPLLVESLPPSRMAEVEDFLMSEAGNAFLGILAGLLNSASETTLVGQTDPFESEAGAHSEGEPESTQMQDPEPPVPVLPTEEVLLGSLETIQVRAEEDLLLRVTILGSGIELFRGSLQAGQTRNFPTEKVLLFTTNRAEHLTLNYRGTPYSPDAEGPLRVIFPALTQP